MDPMLAIFGETSRELFARERLYALHGEVGRLPEWMRSEFLTDVPRLCKRYQGIIEVARGCTSQPLPGREFVGSGGQVRVSGARPDALLALGVTVYLAELEPIVPESSDFLRSLEASLGVPSHTTSLGLFINAPGSGLPMHHDSHDQLLIQLSGTKKFTYVPERVSAHPNIQFAPASIAHPQFGAVFRHGFPADLAGLEESDGQTIELNPGSAFFMPAGTLHRTTDQDELAVSLVLAVRPPAVLDLIVNALQFELLQSSALRAPAYGYFGGTPSSPVLPETLREISRTLVDLDVSAFARAWLANRHREGALVSYAGAPYFEYIRVPSTLVRWVELGGERVQLRVRPVNVPEEHVLELAQAARPIVEYLLTTRAALTVRALVQRFEAFEENDVVELADKLCRVGLLRPLPYPVTHRSGP